jgi:hypothetical protein
MLVAVAVVLGLPILGLEVLVVAVTEQQKVMVQMEAPILAVAAVVEAG